MPRPRPANARTEVIFYADKVYRSNYYEVHPPLAFITRNAIKIGFPNVLKEWTVTIMPFFIINIFVFIM